MSYDEAEAEKDRIAAHYLRAAGGKPVSDYRLADIEYIDITPKRFNTQIALGEYVERIKRVKLDAWQWDLCNRLQAAVETRDVERTWLLIHAEAQLGKTTIISQCFPAWLLGHDPEFRFALAMYNETRSEAHSAVVIQILTSPIHKDIFRNKEGWLAGDVLTLEERGGLKKPPRNVSKAGWMTNARRELNDGQLSFNPVGLQSGLTGSGFDWLSIDDPYKEAKEAFSPTVRESMQNFWEFTVLSRAGLHSCISGMFHRYHVQDLAGALLDTGDFDYVRYATVCDGPYIHDATGQQFEDPLGREEGEYISPERRPPKYYAKVRQNKRIWNSMFQGRPSSEEGDFFNVGKLGWLTPEQAVKRLEECMAVVRSYDHAASEKEGAAFTVGSKMGIRADGRVTVFHVLRKRLDASARDQAQKDTAEKDGPLVVVTVPNDPGAAGDTVVYHVQQLLEGYTVVDRPTTGSKEDRARNFSSAVNSGEVDFVLDEDLPEDEKWNKDAKNELRDFPLSEFKDVTDSMADGYNELIERFREGLVVKNYDARRNLTTWQRFAPRFGNCLKIPATFTVYVGVKTTPLATQANAAAIVVRAPQNAQMGEKLFVIAEYKEFTDDVDRCFKWIGKALQAYCANPKGATIWLHPDSEQYKQVIWQKLNVSVSMFAGDEFAGLSELAWYLLPTKEASPFNEMEADTHLYGVVMDEAQVGVATDNFGLYAFRQECATWAYAKKKAGTSQDKKPSAIGAVVECVRMVTYCFRTVATPLTKAEKVEVKIDPALRVEAIHAMPDGHDKDSLVTRRNIEVQKVVKDLDKPVRGPHASRFARR